MEINKLEIEELMAFLMFLVLISFIIQKMQWPPIGDILLVHGPLTAMQYFNGKVTFTSIYNGIGIRYPIGVHVVIANLYCITNNVLLIPQAILIFQGLLIIMILYYVYYIASRFINRKIALTLTLILFYISYVKYRWLENWFMGQLYNGSLTWTHGILLLLILAYIDLIEKMEPKSTMLSYSKIIKSITCVLLLISYPNFFIFAILASLLKITVDALLVKFRSIKVYKHNLNTSLKRNIIPVLIFIMPLMLYSPHLLTVFSYSSGALLRHFYSAKNSLLNDLLCVALISLALISILYNIVIARNIKRVNRLLVWMFVLGIAVNIIQLVSDTNLINILTPRRLLLFAFIDAVPVSLYMTSYIETRHAFLRKITVVALVIASLIALSNGLYPQLVSDNYAKIMYSSRVYDGKERIYRYIYENLSSHDTLLVEPTWSSLWIYSIKVINSTYWLGDYYSNGRINQGEILGLFLDKKDNMDNICEKLVSIIRKYNVTYILVTEEKTMVIKDPATGKLQYVTKRINLYNVIDYCEAKYNKAIRFELVLKMGENVLIKVLYLNEHNVHGLSG